MQEKNQVRTALVKLKDLLFLKGPIPNISTTCVQISKNYYGASKDKKSEFSA